MFSRVIFALFRQRHIDTFAVIFRHAVDYAFRQHYYFAAAAMPLY